MSKGVVQPSRQDSYLEEGGKIIAFLVGNAEEWDDTRADGGDLELFNCFCELLPSTHIKYLIDEGCQKSNCENALQSFLQSHDGNENTTLVFYYCGHGLKDGLAMQDDTVWKYTDIVQTIQENFCGHKVWCLLDCCYSGAFIKEATPILKNNYDDNTTYLCITSSAADVVAFDCTDDQWNLSGPFVRAMRGELKMKKKRRNVSVSTQDVIADMARRHAFFDGNEMQCELITTGYEYSHNIDPQKPFPFLLKISNVVTSTPSNFDLNSDNDSHVSSIDAQCATLMFFVNGEDELNGIVPYREKSSIVQSDSHSSCSSSSSSSSVRTKSSKGSISYHSMISKSSSGISKFDEARKIIDENLWKQLVHLDRGDYVYAKWEGGCPSKMILKTSRASAAAQSEKVTPQYMFPIYYKGIVLSKVKNITKKLDKNNDNSDEIEIQFQAPQPHSDSPETKKFLCWNATCSMTKDLLPSHFFRYDTQEYYDSNLMLAKKGRYLDQTSFPVGTPVWAIYDDTVYAGKIVDPVLHVVTHKFMKDGMNHDCYGPFLWVEWKDEGGDCNLVPRHRCYRIGVDKETTPPQSNGSSVNSDNNGLASPTFDSEEKPTVNKILELNHELYLESQEVLTPLDSLMIGLKSMGRQLVLEKERKHVRCYYDGQWLDAFTSCEIPSITVLADHLHFFPSGNYHVVQWHMKDGTHSIVPEILIQHKRFAI